ncbi:MAG: DUF3179 domain-containing protein [Spirochaetaceae bacterium]
MTTWVKYCVIVASVVGVLAACSTGSGDQQGSSPPDSGEETNSGGTAESSAAAAGGEGSQTDFEDPELPDEHQGQSPPGRAAAEFETDFSRAAVSYDEIVSGGPPKDGIPAIDEPDFVEPADADEWLEDDESVLVVETGESGETGDTEARIYPLQILMWHEIVNDVVGGKPVTVTYCPLCNTGLAFDRRFDGRTLDFGTTGRLRHSNLIMYDRQTESWWQQATGRGIAGAYAGARLDMIPMLTLSWGDAREQFSEAPVLSRNTGYNRSYGRNPYAGYDTSNEPFLFRGDTDDEFSALTRVITVFHDGTAEAVPYPTLETERAVTISPAGEEIVVLWEPGTASPLDDGQVAGGRDVGTANAFFARAEGRSLDFHAEGGQSGGGQTEGGQTGRIVDEQTGSTWDASGKAVSGPLEGTRLEPVATSQHFWFSWSAFEEESR